MSLLSDIKFFLKKYLKNPVLVTAVAYTVYKLLTKYSKKEAFAESIKVVKKSDKGEVIYDDKLKTYIFIDAKGHDVFHTPNKDKIMRLLKQ
jgi:hypothetical protein